MRALILRRHAQVIFDDLCFGMPNGDDVGDVRVFLLESNAFAADCRFFEAEFFIEPVNDVGESGDRVDLVDVRI